MQRGKNQAGDTHAIVIIVAVVIIIGILGFIFWNNFSKKQEVSDVKSDTSRVDHPEAKKDITTDPYDGWKTQKSITASNLSFKYPADWNFTPATEEFVNNLGGKSVSQTLYSKKPNIVAVNGGPVTTNQFICVTFNEYTGSWQYSNQIHSNDLSSENIYNTNGSIFLNTYSDVTLDRKNKPMGNIMRLVSNPPSTQGQSYIDTRNNYNVEVVAQYNCIQGGEGIENLDADFNMQPDTITAKLIMKSISF